MSVWPDERVAELRRLIDAGLSYRQIGLRLGTTKNAIIGKAHRLSIYGERLTPKPYTAADIDAVASAISAGFDLATIAAAMGRTRSSVRNKIEALGMDKPLRRKPAPPATSRTAQNEGVRRLKAPISGREGAAHVASSADQSNLVTRPAPRLNYRVRPVVDGSIPFMDRASYQCAFILGDHRQLPAMCCGKDVAWRKDGTPLSYCAEHRAIVYTASQPPQEPANESRRMQARAFG